MLECIGTISGSLSTEWVKVSWYFIVLVENIAVGKPSYMRSDPYQHPHPPAILDKQFANDGLGGGKP